jgi:hypothetical protein
MGEHNQSRRERYHPAPQGACGACFLPAAPAADDSARSLLCRAPRVAPATAPSPPTRLRAPTPPPAAA